VKTAAIIAVFLACSFVGFKPDVASPATCGMQAYVYGQLVTISPVTKNMTCRTARAIVSKSLSFIINHGGAGNGDFYIRVLHVRTHCFANGELPDNMHVSCRRNNGRIRYAA
jgi:hypothetical protein